MDTEAANANMIDNSMGMPNQTSEATPMDTEESANNSQEAVGESHGLTNQAMVAENHAETMHQQMPTKSDALSDAFNHNPTASESAASNALPVSSVQDQLDAAHDNLATLAAVSAAGAEAVTNANSALPTIPAQQTALDNINSNQTAIDPSSGANAAQKPITPAAAAPAPPPVVAPTPPIDEEDAKWHSVGIFQGLSTTVTSYIDNSAWTSSGLNLNSDEIPDLSQFDRINLEPGTAYRFRIRALNSVGASDWSEISSFKTCLPGFPGAPSAIKISKSSEGAHLTWEPPPSCVSSNEIVEYSVYLAVKPGKEKETKVGQRAPAQLAFVRVYVGAANQCTVSHNSLSAAHVDCSNKPAIIFRIAARNEKGYGPATQVRWLQDPVQNSTANPGLGPNSLLSPTRVKPELGGASPSKRFKAATGR